MVWPCVPLQPIATLDAIFELFWVKLEARSRMMTPAAQSAQEAQRCWRGLCWSWWFPMLQHTNMHTLRGRETTKSPQTKGHEKLQSEIEYMTQTEGLTLPPTKEEPRHPQNTVWRESHGSLPWPNTSSRGLKADFIYPLADPLHKSIQLKLHLHTRLAAQASRVGIG
ncbi:Hypothetical predicted protein [Pelobates cultripes]|uniref:Uncharacterized protein n=1 Tax=Pelobates cultripes TaxID=61616 RepID=A0AAD1T370_PELCU|nr:Hypothetical predicted protein [Pelobates cultripes]